MEYQELYDLLDSKFTAIMQLVRAGDYTGGKALLDELIRELQDLHNEKEQGNE